MITHGDNRNRGAQVRANNSAQMSSPEAAGGHSQPLSNHPDQAIPAVHEARVHQSPRRKPVPSTNTTPDTAATSSTAAHGDEDTPAGNCDREKQPLAGTRYVERGIHWKAPTIMLFAFLLGAAFASGHHFFYKHYNGAEVGSDTQQRWILRGGTAFAFAIKTSLAISVGVAFVQQLWLTLQRDSYRLKRSIFCTAS